VLVILELGSRRVVHFGVIHSPGDAWLAQQIRKATPFGAGRRILLKDDDARYVPDVAGNHIAASMDADGDTPGGSDGARPIACIRPLIFIAKHVADEFLRNLSKAA